jgi:hydrogenase maturation protein HypF
MLVVDWEPVLRHVLIDWESGCLVNDIAAGIHIALADAVVSVASALQETRVALSGGCFQNAYLTQAVVASLQQNGFEPFWHQNIPPNDGGLSVGRGCLDVLAEIIESVTMCLAIPGRIISIDDTDPLIRLSAR